MIKTIPLGALGVFVFLTVAGFSAPAFAQATKDDGICGGVVVPAETSPARLMRVVSPAPRTNFVESRGKGAKAACPSEAAACQRKGFVVQGDEVLAGPTRGGFVCVTYISPNARRVKGQFSETNGFLPIAALQDLPTASPKAVDFTGKWARSAEAEIAIAVGAGGKLKIDGEATFGAFDPGRVARGAVNSGVIEEEAVPKGDMIALGEGYDGTKPFDSDRSECQARIRLFGRYLAVEDNIGCGGVNVSFTGVYIQLK